MILVRSSSCFTGSRVTKQRGWDMNQNGQFDAGEADNPVIYLYNQRDQLTSEGVDLDTDGIPTPPRTSPMPTMPTAARPA